MRLLEGVVPAKLKSYRISTTHLTLLLLCVLFVGVTLQWLRLDRAAPHWDDSWYLANSLVLYDSLVEEGFAGYVKKFLSILEFKAPLIAALPTPFYVVLGRRWHAAYLVNIASMLVLFCALYQIGARLWHPRAGLIAVFIAGTMPLLYGLSRWYLVEYSLTAVVTVAIALLLKMKSDCTRVALLFGIVCGLGLLLKVSFPLFVIPSFLVVLWRHTQRIRLLVAVTATVLVDRRALVLASFPAHHRPRCRSRVGLLYDCLRHGFYFFRECDCSLRRTRTSRRTVDVLRRNGIVSSRGPHASREAGAVREAFLGSGVTPPCVGGALSRVYVWRQQGCPFHRADSSVVRAGFGVSDGIRFRWPPVGERHYCPVSRLPSRGHVPEVVRVARQPSGDRAMFAFPMAASGPKGRSYKRSAGIRHAQSANRSPFS